jgi:hypothetical protein
MDGRTATWPGSWDERGEQLPLGVGESVAEARRAEVMDGFLSWTGIGTAGDHTGFSDTL